jgi:putative membrane protein
VKSFLQRWFVTAVGVLIASQIVPGIHAETFMALLAASLLLGIFNAFLRPIMLILSIPLLLVTLGLFTLVINAMLLLFVGYLVGPFHVSGFWAAFFGGLVISAVSFVANGMIGKPEKRPAASDVPSPSQAPKARRAPPPSGPVIDV